MKYKLYMNHESLSDLISNNIFKKKFYGYECGCGSYVFKFNYKKHLNSKKHIEWMMYSWLSNPKQCTICYNVEYEYYTCYNCRNKHCIQCNSKIEKCPYCRNEFFLDDIQFVNTLLRLINKAISEDKSEKIVYMSDVYNLCVFLYEYRAIVRRRHFSHLRECVKQRFMEGYRHGWDFCYIFINIIDL